MHVGKSKNNNLDKFKALQEVDSFLDSSDVTYIRSGDRSLLHCSPESTWKLHLINAWLRSVQSCIRIGKKFAFKNNPE